MPIVETLIGVVLGALLKTLTSKEFWELFKKWKFNEKLLTELKFALLAVSTLLSDAEDKQITNPSVKQWLDELRDAVYEAEDVLDEISAKRFQSEMERTSKAPLKKLKDIVTKDKQQINEDDKDKKDEKEHYTKKIESKIEKIIASLKSVAQYKDVLGLREEVPKFPSTSLVDESPIIGRETDKKVLLDFLSLSHQTPVGSSSTNDKKGKGIQVEKQNDLAAEDEERAAEILVAAIVGMPGVGKTTLAQHLFNDDTVIKEGFSTRMWIHVSEEFDILKITRTIYESLTYGQLPTPPSHGQFPTPPTHGQFPTPPTHGQFPNPPSHGQFPTPPSHGQFPTPPTHGQFPTPSTHGQFPTPADLNTLQVRLQAQLKKKKFLLVLDDIWNENFTDWDLLLKPFRAAKGQGRIIVTTCSSKVASSMRPAQIYNLSCLSDKDCWSLFAAHAFHGQEIAKKRPEKERIGQEIVKKCNGLPLAAKTLGALLYDKKEVDEWNAILNSEIRDFPSDRSNIIPALRLSYYQLPSHLKRCFAYCSIFPKGFKFEKQQLTLLWRAEGLLPESRSKELLADVGEEYFHELLSRSFFQPADGIGKQCFAMHDLFRDLARSVAGEFCFMSEDGRLRQVPKKVRYFSFTAEKLEKSLKFDSFQGANHLRTFLPLGLDSSQGARKFSDSGLADMLPTFDRLRVLSLRDYAIDNLNASLGKLKYLRYLDLSGNLFEELNHVCSLVNLEILILAECRNLKRLPEDLQKLINLHHFDISGTNKVEEMPENFGGLKSLRVLNSFVAGTNGSRIKKLKELSNLRTLSIIKLGNVSVRDELSDILKDKSCLSELVLRWESTNEQKALQEANTALQEAKDALQKAKTALQNPENALQKAKAALQEAKTALQGAKNALQKAETALQNLRKAENALQETKNALRKAEAALQNLRKAENALQKAETALQNLQKAENALQNAEKDLQNAENAFQIAFQNAFPIALQIALQNAEKELQRLQPHENLKKLNIEKYCGPTFPEWLTNGSISALVSLHLKDCAKCSSLTPLGQPFRSLEILKLDNMPLLSSFEVEEQLPSLEELHLRKCEALTGDLPKNLPSLKILHISECGNLQMDFLQGTGEQRYKELKSLTIIQSCNSLDSFPLGYFEKLENFEIEGCEKLNLHLLDMSPHSYLQKLTIRDCPKLAFLPEVSLPTPNLSFFLISECESLDSLPAEMHSLTSLQELMIYECQNLQMESFPEDSLLPTTLTSLRVHNLQNLKTLNHRGLQNLTRLETLEIHSCDNLKRISGILPLSLSHLEIIGCDELEEHCKEGGRDWDKISHISEIIT